MIASASLLKSSSIIMARLSAQNLNFAGKDVHCSAEFNKFAAITERPSSTTQAAKKGYINDDYFYIVQFIYRSAKEMWTCDP
ncbi:hypothetical protein PsorP6_002546 [Peronosclerospora sorghi]|uniref:Uncharacterized protein n=1 Tax=Peronosclerospora sorghi TaxID=230839 RepID=A0ACC0WV50_9STRA|nr:hypothetical protein PsorP6_002546 [Peronosclerospora sorghi]